MKIEYLVGKLQPLVSMLGVLHQNALAAANAIGQLGMGGVSGTAQRSGPGQARRALQARREESRIWEDEQARRAALGREQFALENEIARVRKQAADDGIRVTDDQLRRIAERNLEGNAARAEEGRGAARSGGGGGRTRERADEYQRLAERISESTANLVAETEVQRRLNPLIEDYGFAIEKARTEQDLLNAAKSAGLRVTPQLREQIRQLADQYAMATVEAAQLAEEQGEVRRRADEMRDLKRDTLGGFIKDLKAGKSGAEALSNAISRLSDKLLDLWLSAAFDGPRAGSGNIFGNLFAGIGKILGFSQGTANTGGRRGQPRGVVHGQEAVIPLPNSGKVPVQIQAPVQGFSGQRGGTLNIHVSTEEGEMFRPVVRAESQDVSVRVSQSSIERYDKVQKAGGVAVNQSHHQMLKRR